MNGPPGPHFSGALRPALSKAVHWPGEASEYLTCDWWHRGAEFSIFKNLINLHLILKTRIACQQGGVENDKKHIQGLKKLLENFEVFLEQLGDVNLLFTTIKFMRPKYWSSISEENLASEWTCAISMK